MEMDCDFDIESFAPIIPRDLQATLTWANTQCHLDKHKVHYKRYLEQLEKNHQPGSHCLALFERPKTTVQDKDLLFASGCTRSFAWCTS
jgi:hypothetical protein